VTNIRYAISPVGGLIRCKWS